VTQTRPRNLLVPTLVALVFFGPVIAATLMYFLGGATWRPSGSTARGELFATPRQLPVGPIVLPDGQAADFGGKWTLVYVGRGDCDDACKQALYRTRQVRRALGKEMGRVQRLFLSTGGVPATGFMATEHPGMLVLPEGLATRELVLTALGSFAEGDVFVVDPLGNLVLRFPAGMPMKDMHHDIELLLKASQIG
jgi:hypothetical protein